MDLRSQHVFIALTSMVLAGCANIPADRGYRDVHEQVAERGMRLPADINSERSAFVAEILASPLTADAAVRVALVANPRLRLQYAQLGISGAEVIRAGRLSNPTLASTWQSSSAAGDSSRYDFGLTQNFAELLLLPARTRFAKGEFERAKLDAIQRLLDLDADVRAAYYELVGAKQIAQMRKTVAVAAVAAAELSQRFKNAGNFTALRLAIDRAAASQATLDEEQAEAAAVQSKRVLNELMGLDADAVWEVARALPGPLAHEDSLPTLQRLAAQQRADLDSDRRAVVLLEDVLGVTRSFRFVGQVDVGAQYERDTDRSRLIGPSLSLQLPIFNQGQAAVLRAESLLEAARAQLRAKELEVSNRVRAAHERVLAARKRIDRLKHETIPLRERIVARTQEQQNYMLVGIFDLLRVKRDEYDTYQQYLESVRDYWLMRVQLAHAVGSHLPSDDLIGAAVVVPGEPVERGLNQPGEEKEMMMHESRQQDHSAAAAPKTPKGGS